MLAIEAIRQELGRIDRMFKAVEARQQADAVWLQAQPELEALLDALAAVPGD